MWMWVKGVCTTSYHRDSCGIWLDFGRNSIDFYIKISILKVSSELIKHGLIEDI